MGTIPEMKDSEAPQTSQKGGAIMEDSNNTVSDNVQ